ncbi:MAG: N-acetylmuramoyl-L-alanine amidase [Chloroflexi bacterium]|nr:MAG: N-acetylmuramoyl-L-alanine amidase [Chloroflexota bacterium]
MLAALLAALVLFTQPILAVDVALDPGHSRADIGSVGGGLREYQLTLDLARRVRTRLESAHLSVRLTREDDQPLSAYTNPLATEQIQAEQQPRIAAAVPSRIYVSLHFNVGPTQLRATETYFNPERAPEAATADYSLGALLQEHVVEALAAEVGYASLDRGVKSDLAAGKPYGHFFGLRGPVPSALVENLFLSNPDEGALLRDDATLDALADGCAQGVLEYLAGAPPAADGLE